MKAVFGVIIGFAILSMIVYLVPGLYDGVSGNPQGVYATVRAPGLWSRLFGTTTDIKTTEVNRMAQLMAQRQGLPLQYASFMAPQAQQILVAGAIEQREAERLGLVASADDVRSELKQGQLGAILFPGGQFIGNDKYSLFVQANGFNTPAEFEDRIREDLTRGRLVQFVTANAIVSDSAVRDEVRQQGTKVKFDYASISAEEIGSSINPIDSDLLTYFNRNQARYKDAIPEARKISYIAVSGSDLPNGVQVTDADLQTYYNAHKADFHVDEQVKVRHILVKSPEGADAKTDAAAKAKAQDLLNQIRAGADFGALARANSDDPGSKDSGGELGFVKRNHQMVPAFESAAMALKAGQTSDLVKTNFGYHIIQAESRDESHDRPLSEVADQIRPIVAQTKEAGALQSFAQALAAEAAKSGIDKTAADHHLKATTTDFLSQGGAVPGLANSQPLVEAAFAGKKGDGPRVAPLGQGADAVYQTVDVQPAHTPTFAEWKGHVLEDYKAEQIPGLLQARLTKLADRAHQLNDLKKAAAELNIPVKTSDLVDRTGNVPEVGQLTGPASVAFTLPQGGISGPLNTGRTGTVLQVLEKQEPSSEQIAKDIPVRRQSLVDRKRAELFGVYMGTLMDIYKQKGGIRVLAKPTGPTLPLGA